MGFLKKLFQSKESQFREQARDVAARQYPDARFDFGEEGLRVRVNGVDLDLQPLFAACASQETQVPELIANYLSYPVALSERVISEWAEAAPLLRPQLAPADVAKRFGVLTFPFVNGIVISITTKEGGFVSPGDAKSWQIPPEDVLAQSITNLDADPAEMEVTVTDGADRFIGMETHDGFDAARILLPRIREFAAGKLGEPFLAGFPNRSFLILWSQQSSPRFQEYAEEKIETDFAIQPYPLTKARFLFTRSGATQE